MPAKEQLRELAHLIRSQRWAALATLDENNQPLASAVAYVPEPDFQGFLLHLSRLAQHTRNLLQNPMASLVISRPGPPHKEPQSLARVSLSGSARQLTQDTPEYDAAKALYLDRLPDTGDLFKLGDFVLFRLEPQSARYIGGVSGAHNFTAADLLQAATIDSDG